MASTAIRSSRAQVEEFLRVRRFAAIGVSRNAKHFTRTLVREFETRGYEVVLVNRHAAEIGGRKCYSSVQEVQPPVSAALIVTPASESADVVRQCIEAGVRHLWLYRGGGEGAVSSAALAACREQGINVVAGECPLMFLPNTAFVHRVHGLIRRVLGTYPA